MLDVVLDRVDDRLDTLPIGLPEIRGEPAQHERGCHPVELTERQRGMNLSVLQVVGPRAPTYSQVGLRLALERGDQFLGVCTRTCDVEFSEACSELGFDLGGTLEDGPTFRMQTSLVQGVTEFHECLKRARNLVVEGGGA